MAPRARFAHPSSAPPTGWVYEITLDGTKYMFQSPMRLGLMQQLRQWYENKGLEWPGDPEMKARVEDYICQLTPNSFCIGGPKNPRIPFLSTHAIRDATRLFLARAFKGKGILVPPAEAERRAKICASCPSNLHGICTSCAGNEFQDIFRWFIQQGRTTSYDSVLDTCAVCGCLLKAKAHVSIAELATLEKHKYPENCWLHKTECHVDSDPETKT